MADIGVRVLPRPPTMVGRAPNDYALEVQEYLAKMGEFSDSVNSYLELVLGSTGPTGTTPPVDGGSSDNSYFLAGA